MTERPQRIFVTGATGFIGGHVARALLERGDRVVALIRDPDRAQHLAERGAELVRGDITDKASMTEAMRGVDGVFHLAAWYKIGAANADLAERINVGGTRNVLELMREQGVAKGVYTSTLAVFSDTGGRRVDESYRHDPAKGFLSEYDRTKYLAHYDVALPMIEAGLPLVIVQPGLVYGPGDPSATGQTIRRYLQGELPMLPKDTRFTWGHVDDIVEAHLLALDKGAPGESYIVAGPAHTMTDAFDTMERLCGVPAPRFRAAPGLLKGLSRLTGALQRLGVPLPDDLHPEALRVVAGVSYLGDNAKARRELGYAPRPLEAGLRDTLAAEMRALGMPLPATLVSNDSGA